MNLTNWSGRKLAAMLGLAAMLCVAPMIAQTKKAAKGDADKGKMTFDDNCSVCHNSDSDEKKVGPGLKDLFKKKKLANGKALTEANVRALINAGGNGMPAFSDTLSEEERDNVIAYLKTL